MRNIRISPRAVGGRVVGQAPLYTVSLADGWVVSSDLSDFSKVSPLFHLLGINITHDDFSTFCVRAENLRKVIGVDLGDRKLFFFPKVLDEQDAQMLVNSLLEHAAGERISCLSFTVFSFYENEFSLGRCRWILRAMQRFDAVDGPYRLWFEIPEDFFQDLTAIASR